MTLDDLYREIAPTLPASVQKDLKTAVRVLSRVLQHKSPATCPVESCLQPLPTLYRQVETYLQSQGESLHTVRNTKNYLSRLFREAEQKGLVKLTPAIITPAFNAQEMPKRPGSEHLKCDGSRLVFRDWPPELQQTFTKFAQWANNPLVEGRNAKLRKRPITTYMYMKLWENYFGYLYRQENIPQPAFDDLFNIQLIKRFTHWQINIRQKRANISIIQFLQQLLTITNQYKSLPKFRKELIVLKRSLPKPAKLFNKADAWVPLQQLYAIGEDIWPKKLPKQIHGNGALSAARASYSLMLRLWTYIPYRQRNIREMSLDTNLYKSPQNQWRIKFTGEQLKVGVKQGKTNELDFPFPLKLVPALEAYLAVWRPLLISAAGTPSPYLFLNNDGRQHNIDGIRRTTRYIVYKYTGKLWHPHIIRSTWATEWIRNHGDFYTAAIMLNDRLETVIKNYAHLLEENVAEKAFHWIDSQVDSNSLSK